MRTRRTIALFAIFACILIVTFYFATRLPRPSISIDSVTYRIKPGGDLIADFRIVNTGKLPITFRRDGDGKLAIETKDGWITDTERGLGPGHFGPDFFIDRFIVLRPGASTRATANLARDVLRWQVGYTVSIYEPPQFPVLLPRPTPMGHIKNRFIDRLRALMPRDKRNPTHFWSSIFVPKDWLALHPNEPFYMEIPFTEIVRESPR